MMEDGLTLEQPALGRPMQLGMLYDCRNDTFITGVSLWDPEFVKTNQDVRVQQGTRFSILASDSINNKLMALNAEASLKVSLLADLVDVRGSAEFISDKKTSRQSRMILQYTSTVRFEQLTMRHLGRRNVHYPHVLEQGTCTHVVTGVLYGAQAFFVFDRYLEQDENEQQVKEHMSALIKKIPYINMEGKCDLELNESEKKEADKLECKFYGDIAPQSNPTTYQDAASIYTQLPSMLGVSGECAVPLTVWLYPLSRLDNKAAKLVRAISMEAIDHIQDIFQGLDQCKMKCDDLEKCNICTDFPKLKEKLALYKNLVLEYKRSLQRNIARALPKIRGGEAKEKVLLDIISDCRQSPFNVHQLGHWLECREKEMNILKVFMKGFEASRIIRSREDLNMLVLDFCSEHTNAVIFSFSSVGLADGYLKALSRYIGTQTPEPLSQQVEWYDNMETAKNMRIKAKQFKEFASANKESEKTNFAVMGFDDGTKDTTVDGGSIFLYENGVLITKDFRPPGAPGKPEGLEIFHNYVVLKWAAPQDGLSCVNGYRVRYREASSTHDHRWSEYRTEDTTGTVVTIDNLRPSTTYEFSVVASCKVGDSQASPTSNATTTLPSCPPYDVRASITVTWEKPSSIGEGLTVSRYKVKSIPVGDTNPDHVLMNEVKGDGCSCMLENLQPHKTYSISVSASFGIAGDSEFSKPVEITATPAIDSRLKNIRELISECKRIRKGNPSKGKKSIFKLPLTEGNQGTRKRYHTYSFGKARNQGKRQFVFMVVGATGAGKSTLINGMINYIFDVKWNDNFRFKFIADEGENKAGGQAHSQTQLITSYTINPTKWSQSQCEYVLTIIDTPGFGDTRGIARDKVINKQIRDFFSDSSLHHIDHIDVIGFVAQASQARLTPTQKYVFDSVLSVFGKDIEQNISLLVTFADGQNPPVLDAVRAANIPCSNNVFKFNNSALFANKASGDEFSDCGTAGDNNEEVCVIQTVGSETGEKGDRFNSMFWEMGVESMRNFFFALPTMEPRSLSLTQEVLKERERLEVALEGLQPQIKMGCGKLDELHEEQRILEQHEADIEANKDFNYFVDVQKSRKIDVPRGKYITNCSRCHFTCHYPCAIADDSKKSGCAAMKRDGTCNVCPGKCVWNVNFNQAYKFEFYTEKEIRNYSELEQRYNDASGSKLTVEEIIIKHREEFMNVQECVYRLIEESNRSLKRLEEIALRPNPLSELDYVDLMIQSEEMEASPGWKARVKALQEVRKGAEIMTQIKQSNYNPFQKYRECFAEKENKKAKGPWAAFVKMITSPFRGVSQSSA